MQTMMLSLVVLLLVLSSLWWTPITHGASSLVGATPHTVAPHTATPQTAAPQTVAPQTATPQTVAPQTALQPLESHSMVHEALAQDAERFAFRFHSAGIHLSAAKFAGALGIIGAVSLLDETLHHAVRDAATPARDAFFGTVTHLGDGMTAVALTAALWPHDRETAQLVARAGLRTGLATLALKSVIQRARPYEDAAHCADYRIGLGSCVSMPSGHTATAFSMARVLAHQYPEQSWLWYSLAILAGWSRVETNSHWPSDVVAGAFLGLWAADSVLKQHTDGRNDVLDTESRFETHIVEHTETVPDAVPEDEPEPFTRRSRGRARQPAFPRTIPKTGPGLSQTLSRTRSLAPHPSPSAKPSPSPSAKPSPSSGAKPSPSSGAKPSPSPSAIQGRRLDPSPKPVRTPDPSSRRPSARFDVPCPAPSPARVQAVEAVH